MPRSSVTTPAGSPLPIIASSGRTWSRSWHSIYTSGRAGSISVAEAARPTMIVWSATAPPILPAMRARQSVALPRRCPGEELDSAHAGVEIGEEAVGGGAWHGMMLEDGADWEDATALRCDLVRFLAMQPTRLQECCRLLLTDFAAEAGRVLGRHRSSVYAWLAILRERARVAGLAIYLGVTPTDSMPAE